MPTLAQQLIREYGTDTTAPAPVGATPVAQPTLAQQLIAEYGTGTPDGQQAALESTYPEGFDPAWQAAQDARRGRELGDRARSLGPAGVRDVALALAGAGADLLSLPARAMGRGDAMVHLGAGVEQAAEAANADLPEAARYLLRMGRGAGRSLAGMAVAPTPMSMIGLAGAMEGNQAFTESRDAGQSDAAALAHAGTAGLVEVGIAGLLQKIGLGGMEDLLSGQQAFGMGIVKGLKRLPEEVILEEIPTEVLHSVRRAVGGLDPQALSRERLMETIRDTAVQTTMQMGMAAAGRGAVDLAAEPGRRRAVAEARNMVEQARGAPVEEVTREQTRPQAGLAGKVVELLREQDAMRAVPGQFTAQQAAADEAATTAEMQRWEQARNRQAAEAIAQAFRDQVGPDQRTMVTPAQVQARHEQAAADAEIQRWEQVPAGPVPSAVPAADGGAVVAPAVPDAADSAGDAPKAVTAPRALPGFTPMDGLTPQERQWEERFARQLADTEAADAAYARLRASRDGRVLDVDIAREMDSRFAESPEGARERTLSTHEPASAYVHGRYFRALKDTSGTLAAAGPVMMTAGGAGSGKSTLRDTRIEAMDVEDRPAILYDATFANTKPTIEEIEAARAAGRPVQFVYIFRAADLAWKGAEERAQRGGRYVPMENLVRKHIEALETAKAVARHFADDAGVNVEAWLNMGAYGDYRQIPVAELDRIRYHKDGEGISDAIHRVTAAIRSGESLDALHEQARAFYDADRSEARAEGRVQGVVRPDERGHAESAGEADARGQAVTQAAPARPAQESDDGLLAESGAGAEGRGVRAGRGVDGELAAPSDGVLPEPAEGTEGGRGTAGLPGSGDDGGEQVRGRSVRSRRESVRGAEDRPGADVPAGREPVRSGQSERRGRGDDRGERGDERLPGDAQRDGDRGGHDGRGADADAVAEHVPALAGNWVYPDTGFFPRGEKGRYQANVAAIRTLRQIQAEGRARATLAEQEVLAKYVGWGSLPALFNEYNEGGKSWASERAELKELLGAEAYAAARESTKNAHYTHPDIVRAFWDGMQRLGYTGGRYLETSAGIGYYLGLMPAGMRRGALHAVELDPTSAAMLQVLYPDAAVHAGGLETTEYPEGYFDLVASNVPFGDYRVHDPAFNKLKAPIHDYFFLKSLQVTRPGGIVAHITSTGTMDKADGRIRRLMYRDADLVAAIRFPGQTHKESAGTDVVTDLVILRKRLPGEERGDATWLETTTVPDPGGGQAIQVNAYFAAHPEQILGTLDRTGSMYHGDAVNVSRPQDFAKLLQAAMERLPEVYAAQKAAPPAMEPQPLPTGERVKPGGFLVRDGALLQRVGNALVARPASKATVQMATDLLRVRDAARAVIDAQTAGEDATAARAKLNKAYDVFVRKHGPINGRGVTKSALKFDPDLSLLKALEKWDGKTATKADIFTRDTVSRLDKPETAGTPAEALALTLNEVGRLDIDRVAELVGRVPAEVGVELVEAGMAFEDPLTGWTPADEYLSGNVRAKLLQAQKAAALDRRYTPNVRALEKVIPEDVSHEELTVRMGAPWVPQEVTTAFIQHGLGVQGYEARYVEADGMWVLQEGRRTWGHDNRAASAKWATERADLAQVVDAALNDKRIAIYDRTKDASVYNPEASEAANEKVRAVREEWGEWVWQDAERTQTLTRLYNDTFNSIRPYQPNGQHLTFPGKDPGIQVFPHLYDFAWRVVQRGRALAGHEVGTGKTYAMGLAAMELRRLGLARKPCIACLKANVAAVTKDLQTLYPGAKILSTVGQFEASKRKHAVSQIATGDWDMVVMTHDHLDRLPMRPGTETAFIQEEMEQLEEAIRGAKEADGSKGNRVVKQLEKSKARLSARLKELLSGKKDDAVSFEDLGIDFLFVDEAHQYKSLPVRTKHSNVRGIPTSQSQRATNMAMRTRWLLRQNGGRGVVFLTGTPVANTMAELYTMQRYLQPDVLDAHGIGHFDAWASTFGGMSSRMERTPTGELKPVTRFAEFVNIPELRNIAGEVLDIKRAAGMPHIKRPKRKDHVVESEPGEELLDYVASLRDRAEAAKQRKGPPQKGDDNLLVICTDGKKASIDMRLVDPDAVDDPQSKVNRCVAKVLEVNTEHGGKVTQMIFSDVGVHPTAWGFSVYEDIITKLVAGGIPRAKIANFATLTDKAKDKAVKALREGKMLVGIGGTQKMGTGVNAQQYLKALHHLDVPPRPADLEQRDGRGWRNGNTNADIDIYRYVTTRSLDERFWQIIDRKSRFIQQVMDGDISMRDTVDEDADQLSPEELAAIASGDQRIMQLADLNMEVEQLERSRTRHAKEQANLPRRVVELRAEAQARRNKAKALRADAATLEAHPDFVLQVGKLRFDVRKEAEDALVTAVQAVLARQTRELTRIGTYRGLPVFVHGSQGMIGESRAWFDALSLPSLEANARRMAAHAAASEAEAETADRSASEIEQRAGQKWAKQGELEEKTRRRDALQRELMGDGDHKELVVGDAAEETGGASAEHDRDGGGDDRQFAPEVDLGATPKDDSRGRIGHTEAGRPVEQTPRKATPQRPGVDPIRVDEQERAKRGVRRLKGTIDALRMAMEEAGAGNAGLYGPAAVQKGRGGMYDPATGMTAIGHHGDMDATAHEIGHRLDHRFRFSEAEGVSGMARELAFFAQWGSTPPEHVDKDQQAAYRRREGMAEFIRTWIVNPDEARRLGPAVLREFERRMPKALQKALAAFSEEVRYFEGLPPDERTEANFVATGEFIAQERSPIRRAGAFLMRLWPFGKRRTGRQRSAEIPEYTASARDRATFDWLNVHHFAVSNWMEAWRRNGVMDPDAELKPEDNYRVLNRLLAGEAGKVREMIFGSGLTDAWGRPVFDHATGERMTIGWLLDPFRGLKPQEAERQMNRALAKGIEQRVVGEGDKLYAKADQATERFRSELLSMSEGGQTEADAATAIAPVLRAWRETVGDPEGEQRLRAKLLRVATRAATKPSENALLRLWADEVSRFGVAAKEGARKAASRIAGIGGGLHSDYQQATAALARRSEDPHRDLHDEFLRRYRAWANQLVIYAGMAGALSTDQVERITRSGTWTDSEGVERDIYIDFHRVFDEEEVPHLPTKHFKGSTRLIDNPLKNLIWSSMSTIAWADRNRVKQAMVKPLRGEGRTWKSDQVDLHELGRMQDPERVKEARKEGATRIDGRKVYTVRNHGVVEFWTFNAQTEASMEAALATAQSAHNWWADTLGAINRVRKAAITLSPSFLLRQPWRDTVERIVNSETGSGITDILRGYGLVATEDGQRAVGELYALSGASFAGWADKSTAQIQREIAGHMAKVAKSPNVVLVAAEKAVKAAEWVQEQSDALNRRAEFAQAWQTAKDKGWDDYNAMLFAADKARGLIDFAEVGYKVRGLNQVTLFVNPAIQGIRRTLRTARKHPGKAVAKLALVHAPWMIGVYLLQLMGFDDEEREEWRKQPQYVRDFHWMLPMGQGYLAIPKPYEYGFLSSGLERLVDWAVLSHEGRTQEAARAWEGYAQSFFGAILPVDESVMTGALAPVIEAFANRDLFRQRPIVPWYEERLDLDLRRGATEASAIGQALQRILQVDARKVDHVVQGYLGGYGRMATATDQDGAWWTGATTGMTKMKSVGQSRDVAWVREHTQELGLQGQMFVKRMNHLVRMSREAGSEDARRQYREQALKTAAELRERLEPRLEGIKARRLERVEAR